ncbi:MAG: DUF294 nucleotidyltransferase-like domain-containing protein [Albidovulum sp.]|nr:DUF294 nucleotidyltransferase-like domain-containing protein [Albidovulum sp.]
MSFQPASAMIGSVPLAAIEAVAFDLETTGLDASSARVVEFGAARIAGGRVQDARPYSTLVNPGIAIPALSTSIHGIADEDVAEKPGFPDSMAAFSKWAGRSAMLGYSSSFDLSVLEAEHARHGMPWNAPRMLDVEELVQLLAPDLKNFSLETVAEWRGIEIESRHRAVPDAILAARVFASLIPDLRKAGVSSFAEAEKSCSIIRTRTGQVAVSDRAASAGPLNVESFRFRVRVGDVMASPPIAAKSDEKMNSAVAKMVENRVGGLFVEFDADSGEFGILTEGDVIRSLHGEGAGALDRRIGEFCSRPLVAVHRKEFVYRAAIKMSSKRFRHLGVEDYDGKLVGAISARDLFNSNLEAAVSLGREIEDAISPADLGLVWEGLATVARALIQESMDARDITAIISRELRALTRRACEMAEAELLEKGLKPPSSTYAVMVLGSGGRGESMLAMDQDNAIVFGEGERGGETDLWCEAVGCRAARILDEAGVRRCSGGVMASNPAWRMSYADWTETVSLWLSRTKPGDLLNSDIFFDAMPVHGDTALANRLRRESIDSAGRSLPFLRLLAQNAVSRRSPFGWLGRLRLDRGRIDLKAHGVMPLFSVARVLALENGIAARSTAGRLRAFSKLCGSSDRNVEDVIAAHGVFLELILRQQLRDMEAGIPLSNGVAADELSGAERSQLKWSLKQVEFATGLLGIPAIG